MKEELIWQGLIQLGDNPGTYGNAQYAGLCIEFPVQLTRYNETEKQDIILTLEANDVEIYEGYPGHSVTVTGYYPDSQNSYKWNSKILVTEKMGTNFSGKLNLLIKALDVPKEKCFYISVRISVDTQVTPGLYDEFVITRLSMQSKTHYADFGFKYE